MSSDAKRMMMIIFLQSDSFFWKKMFGSLQSNKTRSSVDRKKRLTKLISPETGACHFQRSRALDEDDMPNNVPRDRRLSFSTVMSA